LSQTTTMETVVQETDKGVHSASEERGNGANKQESNPDNNDEDSSSTYSGTM